MNKQEAADWYSKYSSMVRWVGYQGSDKQFHYYIARVMDDWAFIQIRKDELTVTDERSYSTASSAPQYHYLVDPKQDYRMKLSAERDLIVFVGKLLSVDPQPAKESAFDLRFEARFQVLQVVFGRYDDSSITFTVYDHYGPPPFARYDTALMFVSRSEGNLYHEKYQFIPVYPTVEGRWAGCGDPYRFEPDVHRGNLKPVPIKFAPDVKDEKTGKPCTEGNCVEDLFLVKKNGVLKARGWF